MSTDRPTILFVDDERSLLDLLRHWFGEGYDVRTAADGDAALDQLDASIDVVLLDRQMPGVSGDEVLDQIRTDGLDCRVAMVTAIDPDFDIIELGFDDYVTKPVSKLDLQSVIEGLLTRSTYDRALQDYYALVSKRAALEAEKASTELRGSERYHALTDEICTLAEDLRRAEAHLSSADFEVAFRDLDQELDNVGCK